MRCHGIKLNYNKFHTQTAPGNHTSSKPNTAPGNHTSSKPNAQVKIGIPHIFGYTRPLVFINEDELAHTTNRSLHFPVLSLHDAVEFLDKFD
ncbi:hypothetical protein PoB_002185100 [Plakobranchus ocellatus]|uniref:Uncharacterized protein n=1 Tax=Plakobranchus ocellatus TaxID=259542 RepID=A0AAV3Z7Q2_9GAST|nr:hypothetical protein PoB_002185100 [Plakobranchus ocellatus]